MNGTQRDLNEENRRNQPTIGGAFGEGWRTMWMEFPILFIMFLIYISAGLVELLVVHFMFSDDIFSVVVSMVFSLLISWPLFFGVCQLYLRIVRRQEIQIVQIFDGFARLLSIVLAAIIITVSTVLGLIFFVIPGVIIFCKLIFTPYLMMDKDLNAGDAIALSWRLTKGHTGQIFLMLLLAGSVMFVGMLIIGIGLIPAWIWVMLTVASFYNTLTADKT